MVNTLEASMGSRFGWALGLGAAFFALTGGIPAQAKPTWDDVGYNAGHTSFSAKEKTINSRTTVHLANVGSFTSNGWVTYQPVISGGMIYFRSGDGNLYADDMTSGQTVWSQPISSPSANWGAAVNKDRLVVNCVTTGSVTGLCAYDPKTGKKLWTYALDNGSGYSPPTIDGDVVYFLSGGNELNGSVFGQHLVAVSLKDGSEIWRQWYCDDFPTCEGFGGTPAVVKGAIYVGCSGAARYPTVQVVGMCAFKSNGKLLWQQQLGKDSNGNGTDGAGLISAQGDAVYVTYKTNCNQCNYDIDVAELGGSGGFVWDTAIGGPFNGEDNATGAPVIGPDGSIYEAVDGSTPTVTALNANGSPQWTVDTTQNHLYGAPTLAGKPAKKTHGVLFFTCGAQNQGTTCALDAANGSLLWQSTDINVELPYPPLVTGGAVYNTCGFNNICIYAPQ
jgi:outer membrane protein assembly factor BamB